MAMIDAADGVDGAILDINLCGEAVFPVADELDSRDVPFVFWTGYETLTVPEAHRDRPRLLKPAKAADVVRALLARLPAAQAPRRLVLADAYVDDEGAHALAIRAEWSMSPLDAPGWLGAALVDEDPWSRRLRVRLQPGVLYRVPARHLDILRAQLGFIG